MKTKTLTWMLPLVYAGWCIGVNTRPLPDPPTSAEAYDSAVLSHFGTAVELADGGELAQQCGKYLGVSTISGSMIEMASQRRNEARQAVAEARPLATNLRTSIASVVVSALASVQMDIGALAGATPGVAASGGVGTQVNGVDQVTQVVGNSNPASNTISILVQFAPLPALSPGSVLAMAAQNGFTAQAQAGAGGAQAAITSPMGIVSQSVTSNLAGTAGSATQVA